MKICIYGAGAIGNGRLTGIPTPAIDSILALVAQRAKVAELY
jgi:hypothetical protein